MSEILPAPLQGSAPPAKRRELAAELSEVGQEEVYVRSLGVKVTKAKFLALLLYDAVTQFKFISIEGRELNISDPEDMIELVKFMYQHMDGNVPANNGVTVNNVMAFKVYGAVDIDKV